METNVRLPDIFWFKSKKGYVGIPQFDIVLFELEVETLYVQTSNMTTPYKFPLQDCDRRILQLLQQDGVISFEETKEKD